MWVSRHADISGHECRTPETRMITRVGLETHHAAKRRRRIPEERGHEDGNILRPFLRGRRGRSDDRNHRIEINLYLSFRLKLIPRASRLGNQETA